MGNHSTIFRLLHRTRCSINIPASKFSLSEKTWQQMSKNIFKDSESPKSGFLGFLTDFEKTLKDNSIAMPENVIEAYSTLFDKANIFADRMSISISKGNTPLCGNNDITYHYFQQFESKHFREFNILKKYINELKQNISKQVQAGKCDKEILKKFNDLENNLSYGYEINISGERPYYTRYLNRMYDPRISEIGQNIVNPSQYLYHGTHARRSILKRGFSLMPKEKQAKTSAREIGKAVYLTPDKNVASFYAGAFGSILKTKANIKKIAVMNQEQSALIDCSIKDVFGKMSLEPGLYEEIVAELFKRNGFDAVYTRKCLNDDFSKLLGDDIDKAIGHVQTQVAIFNPGMISICRKTLKEKLSDKKLQLNTIWHRIINA